MIHLTDLEIEAQEGTGPRTHIKLKIQKERKGGWFGSTLGFRDKQMTTERTGMALGTENAGLCRFLSQV